MFKKIGYYWTAFGIVKRGHYSAGPDATRWSVIKVIAKAIEEIDKGNYEIVEDKDMV